MKLLTFSNANGGPRVGLADSGGTVVRDLSGTVPPGVTLLDVVREWDAYEPKLAAAEGLDEYPISEVTVHAPFPVPNRDIFCVGKNYSEHVKEFGRSGYDSPDRSEALPEAPVVFPKMTTSVTGPYDDIQPHSSITKELDYEAELGVIIGRGGRGITREDAFQHVWGYTIIDDFTARDLQRKHKQWLLGKSLDTHCPMGPFAVTRDEVADPAELQVQSWVNGELRQDGNVSDLIFDIPELIVTISAGITLQTGDIIATGTPVGVGIGFDPPRFMKSGDVIEVAIAGLGAQRNRIA